MTTGLYGKVMTYDGENRPLSVTYAGNTTSYRYAATGTRLAKVEKAGAGAAVTTLYLGRSKSGTPPRFNEMSLALLAGEVFLQRRAAAV